MKGDPETYFLDPKVSHFCKGPDSDAMVYPCIESLFQAFGSTLQEIGAGAGEAYAEDAHGCCKEGAL